MKHIIFNCIILATLLCSTFIVAAQPLLVGHRGSYWGVENTAEAFRNGALAGYHYLECDIKVAGDGTIVLTHDDTTDRLGGSLTIANSTLAQLKAETYTQTRGGVKYTGKICTLAEYLDICAEYNVRPVIELKWATDINSNDCSGIPALVKLIEEKGFRNKCVILTSMKPCLEYIRTHYPDITLQFLTNSNWANHFDWCVKWRMDVDIEAGGFSKSTVEKFHEAGLKVNVWTANTNDTYKNYGNMGCDFITTDYLDTASLPDLNTEALFPPNVVDYPTMKGLVQGKYTPELVANFATPNYLQQMHIQRAIVRNNKWYVLATNEENKSILSIIDTENGNELKRLSLNGIDIALNDIAFTADGILIGCSYMNVPDENDGTYFILYKWNDDNSEPTILDSIKINELCNIKGFTISGASNDMYLYLLSKSTTNETSNIVGLNYVNGVLEKHCYTMNNENILGEGIELHTTPFSRNNILVNSKSITPTEYTFNWNENNLPLKQYDQFNNNLLNINATGIDFLRMRTKVYAFATNYDSNGANITAQLYDVSDSIHSAFSISPELKLNETDVTSYLTCDIEYTNDTINLYIWAQGVGIYKYSIACKNETTEPEILDLTLETIWENSENKGNKPENIDGTNAQQGAAFDGKFYVNDCVKKQLFIFDENGCIDSLPGGAGYGTACDDAGNIIIRNDKNTDSNHEFLIYPADKTVAPITISATIPAPGQTNFISASGDVLGTGGYIYMFPNKQYAVNIIEVENGKVTHTSQSKELTICGSAAGYVIPMNNNSEQWVYHVRANGFYIYEGGESNQYYVGRSGTKAPQRNTTGGGDIFNMYGNQILLHNSGDNYKGGFTIRNMTTSKAIVSVDPIGTMGYKDGGNYSTFNWLFAEELEDGSFYIYQYCPANGMAMYHLYDRNKHQSQATNIKDNTNSINYYPNPAKDYIYINGANNDYVEIYDIMGRLVKQSIGNRIDISSLISGIYVLRIGEENIKIIKE